MQYCIKLLLYLYEKVQENNVLLKGEAAMDIPSLSDEERDLLAKYRLCDAQNQYEIQALVQAFNGQKKKKCGVSSKPFKEQQ